MRSFPWKVFVLSVVVLSAILFVFPINLFQGVIVFQDDLKEMVVEAPLSLSYFLGLGYNEGDLVGVKDFYLKPSGIFLAIAITIGIPFLVAYRIYLKKEKNG
ncbi:MAG: hypothetical protein N4A41_06980 [Crocinitomicaceae bacterium]|jgi:hypothetical protein|nr:hypothetical protein [Crocinitomicaceae bacterium]